MYIKNLEEATLMNQIFNQLLTRNDTHQIPHDLGLAPEYYEALVKEILEYSEGHLFSCLHSKDGYTRFKKLLAADGFTEEGGFVTVFNTMETGKLRYEAIAKQEARIRNLTETNLNLSNLQKILWIASYFLVAFLGWLAGKFL